MAVVSSCTEQVEQGGQHWTQEQRPVSFQIKHQRLHQNCVAHLSMKEARAQMMKWTKSVRKKPQPLKSFWWGMKLCAGRHHPQMDWTIRS